MNTSPRLAVIVPVFNVEKYLYECINSIRNQTYTNWTLFAVDDGSTDSSGQILDKYEKVDSRIMAIHKKNGGIASARNRGIEEVAKVNGDFHYLFFLDSDDKISENFFSLAVSSLEKTNADLAITSVKSFTKTQTTSRPLPSTNKLSTFILNTDQFAQLFFGLSELSQTSIGYNFMGNKVFRASLISGLRFNETFKTAEDQNFLVESVLPLLAKVTVVEDAFYWYRQRKSSLSHRHALMQDFDTFKQLFDHSTGYTASARWGIQNFFIHSAYNELKHAFYKDNIELQRYLLSKLRPMAFQSLEFPISWSDRKRLLTTLLPSFLLKKYFNNRLNSETSKNFTDFSDYFD